MLLGLYKVSTQIKKEKTNNFNVIQIISFTSYGTLILKISKKEIIRSISMPQACVVILLVILPTVNEILSQCRMGYIEILYAGGGGGGSDIQSQPQVILRRKMRHLGLALNRPVGQVFIWRGYDQSDNKLNGDSFFK